MYNFPELDDHMFVERELMLVEADLHEEQSEHLCCVPPSDIPDLSIRETPFMDLSEDCIPW